MSTPDPGPWAEGNYGPSADPLPPDLADSMASWASAQVPTQAELWAAQNAPRAANAAGCTEPEYEWLLSDRQQAEAAYLARWGSLAPEPRTEAELAAAARAEAWGPQSPVPYTLTPQAEAALEAAEPELEAEP